jgi:hypothetical protein
MKTVLVLQIEDRSENPLLQELMKENQYVCEQNGILYLYKKRASEHVPPYWGKIYEMHKLMIENPNIDYFFWIDSDAFLLNFSKKRLMDFLEAYSKYSVIVSKDMPPWGGEFNAGAFIVKNDIIGRDILKKWKTYYHENKWKYNPSTEKWSTNSVWAGVEYEQGSFTKYFLKNPKYSNIIRQLPYYILNNHSCINYNSKTLIVHFAGEHKKNKKELQRCLSILTYKDAEETSNIEHFETMNPESLNSTDLFSLLFFFLFSLISFVVFWMIRKYWTSHSLSSSSSLKLLKQIR